MIVGAIVLGVIYGLCVLAAYRVGLKRGEVRGRTAATRAFLDYLESIPKPRVASRPVDPVWVQPMATRPS